LGADFGSVTIKMVGSLILILGVIMCLFYWLKRVRFSSFSSGDTPKMELRGTLNLAPKRAVALIEVCDQWLLVGIGTENVTLISRIDPPAENGSTHAMSRDQGKRFHSFLRNTALLQPLKKMTTRGQDGEM
jgi:flagellar biogenesis protein FliO